ncbi:MAG: AraC family transcriptional regulator [Verrucomicrobiota bacterium]
MHLPPITLFEPPAIYLNATPWEWLTKIPDYYNLWYAIEGRGELEIEGVAYSIEPGSLFLIQPHSRVAARQKVGHDVRNFTAHFNFAASSPIVEELQQRPMHGLSIPTKGLIENRMQETISRIRSGDNLSLREAEALVFLILADLFRLRNTRLLPLGDNRLENLLNLIDAQPGSFTRLDQLCSSSGVSAAQLRKLFVKRTGQSPIAYLTRRKMERACYLLSNTNLSISEISQNLSYEDPLYFSRIFKRSQGKSPTDWRNT